MTIFSPVKIGRVNVEV